MVVDQTNSRPPNSDHDPFFGVSLALGGALELFFGPAAELVITGCHMIYFSSHITIQLRNSLLLLHRVREDDTTK